MCLMFLYLNDEEGPDGHRMILANNRDENWDRVTRPLNVWKNNPDCIGGQDLTPGKKGGTWLGASRKGRFGILLNILGIFQRGKKGRGHFINGYLTNSRSSQEYLNNEVISHASDYNSFHLVLLDLSSSKSKGILCSNLDGSVSTEDINNGISTYDNAIPGMSWQKSVQNRGKFEQIVKRNNTQESRDQLVDELLGILKDRTPFENDAQLAKQYASINSDEDKMRRRSAAFVWAPKYRYSTRTHSVILVDYYGQCEFIEQTMKTPIDENNVEWETNSLTFQIAPSEAVD